MGANGKENGNYYNGLYGWLSKLWSLVGSRRNKEVFGFKTLMKSSPGFRGLQLCFRSTAPSQEAGFWDRIPSKKPEGVRFSETSVRETQVRKLSQPWPRPPHTPVIA